MSSEIWLTTDGRYAVSLLGDFSWPTYANFAAAQTFLMGARSLGNFLNLPITGGEITRWQKMDAEIRDKWEAGRTKETA